MGNNPCADKEDCSQLCCGNSSGPTPGAVCKYCRMAGVALLHNGVYPMRRRCWEDSQADDPQVNPYDSCLWLNNGQLPPKITAVWCKTHPNDPACNPADCRGWKAFSWACVQAAWASARRWMAGLFGDVCDLLTQALPDGLQFVAKPFCWMLHNPDWGAVIILVAMGLFFLQPFFNLYMFSKVK